MGRAHAWGTLGHCGRVRALGKDVLTKPSLTRQARVLSTAVNHNIFTLARLGSFGYSVGFCCQVFEGRLCEFAAVAVGETRDKSSLMST